MNTTTEILLITAGLTPILAATVWSWRHDRALLTAIAQSVGFLLCLISITAGISGLLDR